MSPYKKYVAVQKLFFLFIRIAKKMIRIIESEPYQIPKNRHNSSHSAQF